MMTQGEALRILKTGANVFLTGEPGSGKTHTVNAYVAWLRARGIEPAITASTGIAATHIGGFTIHSWSGIGVRRFLSAEDIDAIAQKKNVVRRVTHASVLIIDEVSMLSAGTLSMVDAVCREVRRTAQPFGGLQVVLVGDFFQLPPVSRRQDTGMPRGMFAQNKEEESGFAFSAPVWSAMKPLVCYLSEQYRQEDAEFLELLLALRRGALEPEHRALLESRKAATPQGGAPQLYSHNADVDSINEAELATLKTPLHTFAMEASGPEQVVAGLKRGCLSPETLSLKEGARVMFTKNDVIRERYVNGTLGTIAGFEEGSGFPIVRTTDDDRTVVAEPDEWRVEDGGRVVARIRQVPLRLAWAMTVHKSQGMSLDAAHMDLSGAFEYGQGYVALSRLRTLEGLSLSGFNEHALAVHPDILAKDDEFRSFSDQARTAFASMPLEEIEGMHANFVKACGGKEPDPGAKNKDIGRPYFEKKRGEKKKVKTELVTLGLIRTGMSVEEVAREREIQTRTLLSHLQKLKEGGMLAVSDIAHLASGNETDFEAIHDALRDVGVEKLKPVFERLGGAYPYNTIRLALLFFE